MLEHRRRAAIAIGMVSLAIVAVQHPKVDLRIMTHDIGDPAPRRFQAAVDLGMAGVSVLVTWTAKRLG